MAATDAHPAAGRTVVLEVARSAAALGPCRTSIRHRPCHVVVIAAEAGRFAGDAARVGLWLDPAAATTDAIVDEILARTWTDPDPIVIVDPDPGWPEVFATIAAPIRRDLADLGADVEHVGSTSVPGLAAAKPVIDIDVVVAAAADVPVAIARLRALGYVHQGDKGTPGREAFL